MDGVSQAVTDAWLSGVASNPVLGAVGMLLLVLGMNWIKALFPALIAGGGGGKAAPAPDPEPSRHGWQIDLREAGSHLEDIGEILRARNELARREAEAIERVERLLVELLARERAAARNPSTPRPRPIGGS